MASPSDNPSRRISDPSAMSFGSHLEELRRRIIYALLSVLPLFIVCLVFGESLVEILIRPAQQELHRAGYPGMLIVTNPLETLSAWLKVATVITIAIGIPLILYQLWLFVAPGLYEHERRFAQILMPMSVALSAIALAFLYFIMLPAMLAFLVHFGMNLGQPSVATAPAPPGTVFPSIPQLDADPVSPPPNSMWFNRELNQFRFNLAPEGAPPEIRGTPLVRNTGIAPQYKVSEYVSLFFTTSLAFILGFQTPVVILLLGWVGLIDRGYLVKKRRYAIFFATVASAILAPSPDPISIIGLAIPLYGLFELGLILLKILPAERVIRGFKKPSAGAAARESGRASAAVLTPQDAGPHHDADFPPRREPPDAGDE